MRHAWPLRLTMALTLPVALAACEALTRVVADPSAATASASMGAGGAGGVGASSPSVGGGLGDGEVALIATPNSIEAAPTPGPFDAPPRELALAAGVKPDALATGTWMLSDRVREFRAKAFEESGLAVRGCYYQDSDGDGMPEPGEIGELFIGVAGEGPIQASAKSLDARLEILASSPAAVTPKPLALVGPFKLKFSSTQAASTQVAFVLTLKGQGGQELTRTIPVPIEVAAKSLVARRAWAMPVALGYSIALELHNTSSDVAPAGQLRLAGGNPSVLQVPMLGPRQAVRLSPFLLSPAPAAQIAGQKAFAFELDLGHGFKAYPVQLPAGRR